MWGAICAPHNKKKGMYTYSFMFQVMDNNTQIHVKDMCVTIKRIRRAEREREKERLIARAKQEAEKRLFVSMAVKVANAMGIAKEAVLTAQEAGMLCVCVPYSVRYVGTEEK